jgi:hypothetical protein
MLYVCRSFMVQTGCTISTKALYCKYKTSVLSVHDACTTLTAPLFPSYRTLFVKANK